MIKHNKLTVSHASFWHDGGSLPVKSYHIMAAALLSVIPGIMAYGSPAVGVVSLSIASAMIWEMIINRLMKKSTTIGDGNAAMTGMIFAMLVPATLPWWTVVTGTFLCIVIGKEIFGGIGANPFNPVLVSMAIITISWSGIMDFNEAYVNYEMSFPMIAPLTSLKYFGVDVVDRFTTMDLLLGRHPGGIGATFGLGLIAAGIYLAIRGFIRWEISVSFLLGLFVTAFLFHMASPDTYAGATFHLLTGYSLIGAFFLATEDSSSPVNRIPMFIYGAGGGLMTVLIRNIGAYPDGVVYALLLMNLTNPLIDNIRPKALRKEA